MKASNEFRTLVEQTRGQRDQLIKEISIETKSLKIGQGKYLKHEQALIILKDVGLKTQQELQYHIADICSLALASVFDNPYEVSIEFLERRDTTECDITFLRDGEQIDPLDSSGGGAADVASFALRIASWSLKHPHDRATIILDEPFRFLSAKFQNKAAAMLKEVSDKMGLQFIIVTHEQVLASFADRIFEVLYKKKISRVTSQDISGT